MLEWFVSSTAAEKCLSSDEIITKELVECRPEKVSNSCLDENVDIFLIKKHFTFDAWKVILQILQSKKKQNDWFCKVCNQNLHRRASIVCDSCLCWYHLSCVSLRNAPKKKEWFCTFCYEKTASENFLNKSGMVIDIDALFKLFYTLQIIMNMMAAVTKVIVQ